MGNNKMESPRLCIVTDAWHPQVNGVVTTLENIARQAVMDGWQVLIIHPEMFKSISAPSYPEVSLAIPIGMIKMIRDFKPDHLHVATEGPLGLCARIVFRKKIYTTAYHTQWDDFAKDLLGIPKWITRSYIRWFHEHGQVMVTTKTVAQYLKDIGVKAEIKLLGRGVSIDKLQTTKQHVRGDKPVLLSVGRVSKEKNLETFCELDHTKFDLVLVGDGPILEELKQKYPHVRFTGTLRGSDLANEFANADCFVFTSKKDTYGIVIIEALCNGTPVAAYPVQGPIDILDNDLGAMDDNIYIAIQKALLTNRKKCASIAQDRFTWKNVWEQFKSNLVEYAEVM